MPIVFPRFWIVFLLCCSSLGFSALDLSEAGTLKFARRVLDTYEEARWLLDKEVKASLQGKRNT